MKDKLNIIYVLFLVIACISAMSPNVIGSKIEETQLSEWTNFKIEHGGNWKVSWNDITGTPGIIYGSTYQITDIPKMGIQSVSAYNKTLYLESADDETINTIKALTKTFISDNKNLLKVDDISNLQLLNVEKGNEEWYVEYQQYYQRIPVFNGKVGLTISNKGEIKSLGSDFYPNIDISVIPKISKNESINIARNEVTISNTTEIKDISLTVLPQKTANTVDYYLTWIIHITSEDPLYGYKIFVDVIDGRIVYQYPTLISQICINGTVTGQIWPQNHTDSLEMQPFQNMYIHIMDDDMVIDDELGTDSPLHPFTTNNNGNYSTGWLNTISDPLPNPEAEVYVFARLEGPHIKLFNGAILQNPPKHRYDFGDKRCEQTHDWDWGSGDEQNVYYHVTRIHDYFTGAPFNYTIMTYQTKAHVKRHTLIILPFDNALADGTNIYFGDASPFARESDIIMHEYTHNVVYHIYGNRFIGESGGIEGWTMDECFADYFQASLDNNEHVCRLMQGETFNWEDWTLPVDRHLVNNHNYTVNGPGGRVGESHYDSQILSGACWDIRTAVGQGTTDHIIFKALRNVPHPDTFEEFYYYLLTEDDDNNNLNDGTPHGSDIYAAFHAHGMDFIGFTPQEPWFFEQFNSDGVTEIPFGGITNKRTVVMKTSVESLGFGSIEPNLQLEVEVKPVGTVFNGTPTCTPGPVVVTASTAFATCYNLPVGQYHWQARVKDVYGVTGPWVSAGGNPEDSPDFEIRSSGLPGDPDDFGNMN